MKIIIEMTLVTYMTSNNFNTLVKEYKFYRKNINGKK